MTSSKGVCPAMKTETAAVLSPCVGVMKTWDIGAIFLPYNLTTFVPAVFALMAFSSRQDTTLPAPNTPEQKRDQTGLPTSPNFHYPHSFIGMHAGFATNLLAG